MRPAALLSRTAATARSDPLLGGPSAHLAVPGRGAPGELKRLSVGWGSGAPPHLHRIYSFTAIRVYSQQRDACCSERCSRALPRQAEPRVAGALLKIITAIRFISAGGGGADPSRHPPPFRLPSSSRSRATPPRAAPQPPPPRALPAPGLP